MKKKKKKKLQQRYREVKRFSRTLEVIMKIGLGGNTKNLIIQNIYLNSHLLKRERERNKLWKAIKKKKKKNPKSRHLTLFKIPIRYFNLAFSFKRSRYSLSSVSISFKLPFARACSCAANLSVSFS